VSITSRCSTTVGSTIQNSRPRTRGAAIACLVDVMFTWSDVSRAHWLFIRPSSAPVAAWMSTVRGGASSKESA
jgi:hypothetical protein